MSNLLDLLNLSPSHMSTVANNLTFDLAQHYATSNSFSGKENYFFVISIENNFFLIFQFPRIVVVIKIASRWISCRDHNFVVLFIDKL